MRSIGRKWRRLEEEKFDVRSRVFGDLEGRRRGFESSRGENVNWNVKSVIILDSF